MDVDADRLAAELIGLRTGRGLQDPSRAAAAGELLRQIFELDELPEGDARRERLVSQLIGHAESLPPDLQYIFLAAMAVRPVDRPVLQQRLEGTSSHLKVHVRTVWRRLDVATQRVANSIAAAARPSARRAEWYLTQLHTKVDLSDQEPLYRSTHTIRVVSPFLERIEESISFPGAPPGYDPRFRVAGDCVLEEVFRPYPSTWTVRMRLGRQYLSSESATFSLHVRAPERMLDRPMSVMLPQRECRIFSTEINFGSPSVAKLVWRLDGVPAPVAEIDEPCGPLLDTIRTPVVRVGYRDMNLGRVYGVRWQWADWVV